MLTHLLEYGLTAGDLAEAELAGLDAAETALLDMDFAGGDSDEERRLFASAAFNLARSRVLAAKRRGRPAATSDAKLLELLPENALLLGQREQAIGFLLHSLLCAHAQADQLQCYQVSPPSRRASWCMRCKLLFLLGHGPAAAAAASRKGAPDAR